jgi:hypothetical protein
MSPLIVIGLGAGAQRRLAVLLGDMFGEDEDVSADVAAFLDEYLRRAPLVAAFGLRAAIWAMEWMPIAMIARPAPASALAPETRARYLSAWTGSKIYWVREAFYLVKAIALMGWGAHAVVRARLGLPSVAAEERLA